MRNWILPGSASGVFHRANNPRAEQQRAVAVGSNDDSPNVMSLGVYRVREKKAIPTLCTNWFPHKLRFLAD